MLMPAVGVNRPSSRSMRLCRRLTTSKRDMATPCYSSRLVVISVPQRVTGKAVRKRKGASGQELPVSDRSAAALQGEMIFADRLCSIACVQAAEPFPHSRLARPIKPTWVICALQPLGCIPPSWPWLLTGALWKLDRFASKTAFCPRQGI